MVLLSEVVQTFILADFWCVSIFILNHYVRTLFEGRLEASLVLARLYSSVLGWTNSKRYLLLFGIVICEASPLGLQLQ